MDYGKLIVRAFQITIRHKFLWILGILAGFLNGCNVPDFSSFIGEQDQNWEDIFSSSMNLSGGGLNSSSFSADFSALAIPLIIFLIIISMLVVLALLVISVMARGGLIASVVHIESGVPASFGRGFRAGYGAFWRLLAIHLLAGLIILGLTGLLALPIVVLVITKHYWIALGLGILFLLPWLAAIIYVVIVIEYAARFVLHKDSRAIAGIMASHKLVCKKKLDVFLVWLLALALGMGIGIAALLLLLIVGGILFGLGYLLYLAAGVAATIVYGIVFGLLFLVFWLIFTGMTNTFTSSYWTLAYLQFQQMELQSQTSLQSEVAIPPPAEGGVAPA